MFEAELAQAASQVKQSLIKQGFPEPPEIEWSPIPFSGQWGYGTPAPFQAAAAEARSGKPVNVPKRAEEIAQGVLDHIDTPAGFHRAEAVRGYVNLYLDPADYARRVTDTVIEEGPHFGRGGDKGERVMVEYSQPNTHKAFHIGHLRNVTLGGAMANILEFAGFDTVRANYIGDIGWMVIKWLWAYLRFHEGEEPEGDRAQWMDRIYGEATRLVEENPAYEAEARQIFSRWEAQDPEIVALWKKTRAWSLEGFAQTYETLGENFDIIFFESEVEKPGKKLVEDLIARSIAVDERPQGGPVVVKLDELLGLSKETFRVLVVLRSDGSSLYATKDLPLAIRKFEEWKIDRSIYVIDVRQSLYLKQIFKLLEIMGFEQAKKCHHLSYEIVNLPGNVVVSSREGATVMFDDLVQEAIDRAGAIVEEKNPSLSAQQKKEIAWAVALGAIKYTMLAVDNNKTFTFEWDRALDFEGQAAPYIQYAHVRANSILKRAGELPQPTSPQNPFEQAEVTLLDRISRFPGEVQRAADEYKPLIIANYAYELAKEFSDFYQSCPVMQAEPHTRDVRLRITAAARQTLANSLKLLGIQAPEVM